MYENKPIRYGTMHASHPILTTCPTNVYCRTAGVWVWIPRIQLKLQWVRREWNNWRRWKIRRIRMLPTTVEMRKWVATMRTMMMKVYAETNTETIWGAGVWRVVLFQSTDVIVPNCLFLSRSVINIICIYCHRVCFIIRSVTKEPNIQAWYWYSVKSLTPSLIRHFFWGRVASIRSIRWGSGRLKVNSNTLYSTILGKIFINLDARQII